MDTFQRLEKRTTKAARRVPTNHCGKGCLWPLFDLNCEFSYLKAFHQFIFCRSRGILYKALNSREHTRHHVSILHALLINSDMVEQVSSFLVHQENLFNTIE